MVEGRVFETTFSVACWIMKPFVLKLTAFMFGCSKDKSHCLETELEEGCAQVLTQKGSFIREKKVTLRVYHILYI